MTCMDCGEKVTSVDEYGYCDDCNLADWEEYEAAKAEWEQGYHN